MTSRDFDYLTLRNLTAYNSDGSLISSNRVLVTSTKGQAYWTDNLTLSTATISSFNLSTFTVSSIFANTITVSTVFASSISSISSGGANVPNGTNWSDYLYWDSVTVPNSWQVGSSQVHIGAASGASNQGLSTIAIGADAACSDQGDYSIGIGVKAGANQQGNFSIALGYLAGQATQGQNSIAIGSYAGQNDQPANNIILNASGTPLNAVSTNALFIDPIRGPVTTGYGLYYDSGTKEIVYGPSTTGGGGSLPAGTNYSDYLFYNSTTSNWEVGTTKVHIGSNAGLISQGSNTVAIGYLAGVDTQGDGSIAIGTFSGYTSQANYSVAIGYSAGYDNQGAANVAIGFNSGYLNQGYGSIALGTSAGFLNQFGNNVAIGNNAGNRNQGLNSIAIGSYAGQTGQQSNTIVINATGSELDASTISNSCYIAPIRGLASSLSTMMYDTNTSEVVYHTGKTFVIDHPLDTNRYLVHACLEGPEAGVYYRGKSEIVPSQHSTIISLPNYIDGLAHDFTVHTTPIYNPDNDTNINLKVTEVEDGRFAVYGQPGKFYWHVYGKRLDIDVEPLKENVTLKGSGPYTWL